MNIIEAVDAMLGQGEFEPCKKCVNDERCAEKQTFCVNAIKAKLNGKETWEPRWRIS